MTKDVKYIYEYYNISLHPKFEIIDTYSRNLTTKSTAVIMIYDERLIKKYPTAYVFSKSVLEFLERFH